MMKQTMATRNPPLPCRIDSKFGEPYIVRESLTNVIGKTEGKPWEIPFSRPGKQCGAAFS
jgi:hypothetical protein